MCSASRLVLVVLAGCTAAAGAPGAEGAPGGQTLRVCADPNNLPFSNEAGAGFENSIAQLIAKDLGRTVEYTWRPQRRGFIRETLKAKKCDVVMGVPAGYEMTATTKPYYRSSYVFVTRADRKLKLASLDDPALKGLRIGLHAIGDDYSNVPPAQALARRGLADRIVGYSIYGDYAQPNPPADLIEAVDKGDVDVAIAWGPLAGYFVKHAKHRMTVTPIASDEPGMTFAIAMGVRKNDEALRARLDVILSARADEVGAVLDWFGVPRLPPAPAREAAR